MMKGLSILTKKSLVLGLCVLSLAACKDDSPVDRTDHGSVTLTPGSLSLKYGETAEIVPGFSEKGEAKNKTYAWVNSNKGVVELNVKTGNKAEVKALRAGASTVRIYSTDGKIFADCRVMVGTQVNLLNHVLFEPGRTREYVDMNLPFGRLNEKESTADMRVYDVTGHDMISQEIYCFKDNALYSTLVILHDTKEAVAEAEMYIKERFADLNLTTADGIKYYDRGSFDSRYGGQVVGIFLSDGDMALIPEGVKGKTGVKYTTRAALHR